MAPTLWGPNAELTCPACKIRWKIHWQLEQRPLKPFNCWNCGESACVDDADELPGDQVVIGQLGESPLKRGDLVAIVAESGPGEPQSPNWAVKRVAGLPGDEISHQNGWLTTDDRPLVAFDSWGEPLWIGVHDDSFRKLAESWWRPRLADFGVELTERGFDFRSGGEPTTWLDYHHFAVHDAMRPDVIRDDVAGNAAEVRSLVPVDSLSVTFEAIATESTEIEVAFNIGEASAAVRRKLPPGTRFQRVNSDEAEPTNESALPLVPISIRLLSGNAALSNVVVWRPLRYRIDPRIAAKQNWPIRLSENEYYLLGDNVPLSIDSRDWGPIPRRRIVGRIYAVGYDRKQ